MVQCEYCADPVSMAYKCSLCNSKYCGKHRLAENHSCLNLYYYNTDSYRQTKIIKERIKRDNYSSTSDIYESYANKEKSTAIEDQIKRDPRYITFGSERVDLFVGLVLITFAFLKYYILFDGIQQSDIIIVFFAGLFLGPAFILHELAHLRSSNHFGFQSRFILHKNMTIITLIVGFLPFGIAGPGTATYFGQPTVRQRGIISIAGPIVNLIIGFVYIIFLLFILPSESFIYFALTFGAKITVILGLFNMIPLFNLDGKKVLDWKAEWWFLLAGALLILYFLVPS